MDPNASRTASSGEAGLTLVGTTCPICGPSGADMELCPANVTPEQLKGERFTARRDWEGIHFRWVTCTGCGLWRSDPRPSASELARLYEESPFEYAEEAEYAAGTYLDVVKRASRFLRKGHRLLEIGCGNGSFLRRAAELGYAEAIGVEPSPEAVQSAPAEVRDRIVVDVFKPGLFDAAHFDLVCCFQTLDHVPDPIELLGEARRVLRPDGLFVCVSHDVSAVPIRVLGRRAPVLDVQHTFLYNRRTLRLLVEKAEFEVLETRRIWNCYPLRYWLRLAPMPRGVKRAAGRLLALLRLEGVPLRLSVGNQAMVARKSRA